MNPSLTAYLSKPEWSHYVAKELEENGQKPVRYGDLFLTEASPLTVFWAKNIWFDCHRFEIESIGDAAKKLRALGRNWAPYGFQHFRRMQLIQDRLPMLPSKPKTFPCLLPSAPMGAWTLLDEHTVLASPACANPFPNGEIHFIENKTEAPSRAYLKLYEALTFAGKLPKPGDFCIDAGSSPGGWTWVLAALGATVFSFDRSPLEEKLMKHPLVTFEQGNVFNLKPDRFDKIDWFCCDVICYPEKLLDWLQLWLSSGKVMNFICTLKMQGEPDFSTIRAFLKIPNSQIRHLFNNKHELTWMNIHQ